MACQAQCEQAFEQMADRICKKLDDCLVMSKRIIAKLDELLERGRQASDIVQDERRDDV